MKIFLDYGELLFNYDFNPNTLVRAHKIALEALDRDGKYFDESSLKTAHDATINAYLQERQGLTEWSMPKIMRKLTVNLGIRSSDGLIQKLVQIYKTHDHDASPKQGIQELIPRLAEKYSLHIISNLPHSSAVSELAEYGLLPYFDTVTFSYQAGYRKPHPKIYQLAMKKSRTNSGLFLSHDKEEIEGAKKVGLDSQLVYAAEDIEEALN